MEIKEEEIYCMVQSCVEMSLCGHDKNISLVMPSPNQLKSGEKTGTIQKQAKYFPFGSVCSMGGSVPQRSLFFLQLLPDSL